MSFILAGILAVTTVGMIAIGKIKEAQAEPIPPVRDTPDVPISGVVDSEQIILLE